ncbi:MAG: hypothetical protein KJZ87_02590 [Thermoguttaceae bacterium]|nr:hypothetical protein [Thermoguttaceae bacterium]
MSETDLADIRAGAWFEGVERKRIVVLAGASSAAMVSRLGLDVGRAAGALAVNRTAGVRESCSSVASGAAWRGAVAALETILRGAQIGSSSVHSRCRESTFRTGGIVSDDTMLGMARRGASGKESTAASLDLSRRVLFTVMLNRKGVWAETTGRRPSLSSMSPTAVPRLPVAMQSASAAARRSSARMVA